MFDYRLVDETVRRIAEQFSPKKIIIFGSVARKEAGERSDLDLLIVMESDKPVHARAVPIYVAVSGIRIPKDILVVTPEEYEENKNNKYSFVSEIVRTGEIAYES